VGHQVAAALIAHGLDEPIPATLAVGRGAILLVRGWTAPGRGARVREFVVHLDDEIQRFEARGRAIFLPIVVGKERAGTRARLRIAAGDHVLVDQRIEFLDAERPTVAIDTPIAICLATYNPDPKLLAR
jgi:hypothetical protein